MSPASPPADPRQHWRAIAADLNRRDLSPGYITGKLVSEGCPPDLAKQILVEVNQAQNPKDRKGGFAKIIAGTGVLVVSLVFFLILAALHAVPVGRTILVVLAVPLTGAWLIFRGLVQLALG